MMPAVSDSGSVNLTTVDPADPADVRDRRVDSR